MTVSSEDGQLAAGGTEDPVAEAILTLLAETGAGRSISPEDAARAFAAGRAG